MPGTHDWWQRRRDRVLLSCTIGSIYMIYIIFIRRLLRTMKFYTLNMYSIVYYW